MDDEQVIALAQKAFGHITGVNPRQVTVGKCVLKKGLLLHKCSWQRGGNVVEGEFYQDGQSVSVFITNKKEGGSIKHLNSWHSLPIVDLEFKELMVA